MTLVPFTEIGEQSARYTTGFVLRVTPGDPGFFTEIYRAQDSTTTPGTPDTSAAILVDLLGPGTVFFTDALPLSTRCWHYQARHVMDGFDNGTFTAWITGAVGLLGPLDRDPASRQSPDVLQWTEGRRRTDTIYQQDGVLLPSVLVFDGTRVMAMTKGEQSGEVTGGTASSGGTWTDGPNVDFPDGTFTDAPQVDLFPGQGTIYQQPASSSWTDASLFNSSEMQRVELKAASVTSTGFVPRARLVIQLGGVTARSANFSTGNNINTVGAGTTAEQSTNVPSNTDQYVLHWEYDITMDSVGTSGTVTWKVAGDVDTGGGYVEYQTASRSVDLDVSTPSSSQNNRTMTVTVPGFTSSGTVRLRLKSFTVSGTFSTADLTFNLHGYDGSAGDSTSGVTWFTAATSNVTYAAMCPTTDDTVKWRARSVVSATT